MHVLELAGELALTAEQRRRTESLFASMQSSAAAAGRALIEAERQLDRLFAGKTVTPESLSEALQRIGALQAKVRGVHLEAHLEQLRILTPEQAARYAALRGYAAGAAHTGGHGGGHHKH